MTNKVITKNFKGGVLREYDSRFIRSDMNDFIDWTNEVYDSCDLTGEDLYKRYADVVEEPHQLPATGSLIQIKPTEANK